MSIALNGPAPWYATSGPGLWYATRATGLVTLLLLTASMLLGIITASRFASEKWPRFVTVGLHRNVTLLVLAFLALHVGTTVLDTYTSNPHRAWPILYRLHWPRFGYRRRIAESSGGTLMTGRSASGGGMVTADQ
jgi:ABC-type amino acid transport system permease subunit